MKVLGRNHICWTLLVFLGLVPWLKSADSNNESNQQTEPDRSEPNAGDSVTPEARQQEGEHAETFRALAKLFADLKGLKTSYKEFKEQSNLSPTSKNTETVVGMEELALRFNDDLEWVLKKVSYPQK